MEEEKSPKPGAEPKCIKGAAAGAGGQGRGGRAGGGSGGRCGERRRGGPPEGECCAAAPTPARPRARTHALTRSLAASHCWRTPSLAAISSACRMKSPQPRGHGAPGQRLCAGRQASRRLQRASPVPEPSAPAAPPDLGGGAGQPGGRGQAPSLRRSRVAAPSPEALLAPPSALRVLFGSEAAGFSPPGPPSLALASRE